MVQSKRRESKLIMIFVFIFCIRENSSSADTVSFKDIIKQIKDHEFDPYEINIIHYKEEQYPDVHEELLQATLSASPTKVISYKRTDRVISEGRPKAIRSSLQSILYIVILKGESHEDEKFLLLSRLYESSKNFTPPRCLVVIIGSKKNAKHFKNLYEKVGNRYRVVHLTFIAVELEKSWQKNSITKHSKRNITIHQFDPFNKNYTIKQYEKGFTIFPKYLKNLRGQKLKAMTVHSEPLSFDKNLKYDSIDTSMSPQAKVINFISNELNSTLEDKRKPFFKVLLQQELSSLFHHNDVLTNNLPITSVYGSHFSCYALNLRRNNYKLLLSVQRSLGDSQTETSFTIGLISLSLVTLIWIILWLLKCDKKITQPLNFIGLLFGNTIDVNVAKLKDRILFLSILMGFWLFSSTLYSILTDVKIVSSHTDSINSLKDLQDLNLMVYFSSDFMPLVTEKNRDNTLISMFKRKKIIQNDNECIDFLDNNVHVVCLIEENMANTAVFNSIDETGLPRLKVLSDFNLDLHTAIHFGKNAPYVFEFEMYVQKLEQMGLINKWIRDSAQIEKLKYKETNVSINKSVSTSLKLLFILIIGFGLSNIVFVGEILVKRHEEKILKIYKQVLRKFGKPRVV